MNDIPDSFERLNLDFSKFLRKLQHNHANLSIFLLVDQFVSITKTFNLPSEEYMYYWNKFQSSKISEKDLTQSEIVIYLKKIIERLEKITKKTFKSELLQNISSKNPKTDHDFKDLQKLKEDLIQYPELAEIFKETIENTSESSISEPDKPDKPDLHEKLTPIPKLPKNYKTNKSHQTSKKVVEKSKIPKDDPDLMKILSDIDLKSPNEKESENKSEKSVISLNEFAFKKKIPYFDGNKKKTI